MNQFGATEKTKLKRYPDRGNFDRDVVYRILDEGFICHVGFVVDETPYVIPTGYARLDDRLYIHGSSASRMLRNLAQGVDVCVTVTLVDGLVLARSAFHHSINYRSVIVIGTARVADSPSEKLIALHALTEHIVPGRWEQVREPDEKEMKATLVLCLPLQEVSAKVRTGPPVDDERDLNGNVWGGVLPMQWIPGVPIPDPVCDPGVPVPANIKDYSRTGLDTET